MKHFDVFISHASDDTDWCEQLAEHLRHYGLQAYLEPKEKWQISKEKQQMPKADDDDDLTTIVERGLARSSRLALVLTPNYLSEKKNWVEASRRFPTYQTLTGHREFAIPLLLKDCKLPPFLLPLKCVDFRNPAVYQSNLEQFVAILKDTAIDNNTLKASALSGAVSPEIKTQELIVTIGGTFDTLHKGHKEYVRLAFQFADRVLIYVSSDEYVHEKKDYIVRPYETRVKRLKDFIEEIRSAHRCEIRCLHKLEELESDYLENKDIRNNIYMAVVPPEYYDFFLNLNYTREARGMQPFLILVKLRKRDFKNGDFSSSAIRYHGAEK